MPYLHCGRCGLQIKIRAEFLRLEHCPRCVAHRATLTPTVLSANGVSPPVAWGTETRAQADDRQLGGPVVRPTVDARADRHGR